jgi:hypothetical protein
MNNESLIRMLEEICSRTQVMRRAPFEEEPMLFRSGEVLDIVQQALELVSQRELTVVKAAETTKEIANRNAQTLSLTPGDDKAEHKYYRGQYDACCTILRRASAIVLKISHDDDCPTCSGEGVVHPVSQGRPDCNETGKRNSVRIPSTN